MSRCWEARGCDAEMQSTCPHAVSDDVRCPLTCAYARCEREQHEQTSDPALVFDPEIDRAAAVKHACSVCAFFLTQGPRVG